MLNTQLVVSLLVVELLILLGCPSRTLQVLGICTRATTNRRVWIQRQTAAVVVGGSTAVVPNAASPAVARTQGAVASSPFDTYQVISDASPLLSPTLVPQTSKTLVDTLKQTKGAVWLGEHHNARSDHLLQYNLIEQLTRKTNSRRPIAIGLEQVQVQFQPILDEFVADKSMTVNDLRNRVEWDTRWSWDFANYQGIFELAQVRKLPLVALNVNSEDLFLVETDGLPGLSKPTLQRYIGDPRQFANFMAPRSFSTYVDYVIAPSYDLHRSMGLLKFTSTGQMREGGELSFRNFLSGRMLWDASMAYQACQWTSAHPGGLLVGLVGADHVKYQQGIPGRYRALSLNQNVQCVSMLLNPTLIDTRPSGTVASTAASMSSNQPDTLTLQLRYVTEDREGITIDDQQSSEVTGGVLPLADYILISNQT